MGLKFNPFTGKLDFVGAGGGGSPTGPAGGDLAGTYPNPTVDGLQGNPVSNATPYNGQVLQFDGTSWVPGSIPSGGSGGGGVVYFLNFNTAADAPVTNIPQTPNTSKELAIAVDTVATSYTSANLPTASYAFLGSFVTDLNVPNATSIPAGLWDFNIYAQSSTTNVANQVYFKIEVLKYDGVNAPTLISTSGDTYIYDPTEVTQYVSSCIIPSGVTLTATDRLVVYLYGRAHQANKDITFHFGSTYPSHTHSTMPSVTGTGVVKVVNGVFQSPATTIVNADVSVSAAIDKTKIAGTAITTADTGTVTSTMIANGTIVDADVSASAAIGISKLAMSTNRVLGRTTAGTGAVEEITVGTGLSLSGGTLSSTVTGGVTSVTGTSPIASSGGTTPAISIADAAADGTTKGAAAFNASDFDSASGVISLDYTNGQSASASNKGFLTSADWTTFNNKTGGSVGAVDNAVLRADVGTGIVQNSNIVIDDVATATQDNVAIVNASSATNSALVLTPKGTGALIAGPKPDGAATGGNARGTRAVDLQMVRSSATQVASGLRSVVSGGNNNTASGQESVVSGGSDNSATGARACVTGGASNQANANSSIIGSGENNSITNAGSGTDGDLSAICSGSNNSINAGGRAAFIGAGRGNVVSGNCAVVVGGGERSSSVGNTASSSAAGILCGRNGLADRFCMQAHSAGQFSANGDAQRARFVMRNKTTTNAAVELFLDGSATRLTIPSGKIFAFTINISGVKSDGSAVAHYLRQYCLKNVAGTTSEVYAPVTIGTDNAAGTTIALSANDTNDALKVEVTGITSETWRWVASVDAVEVSYGT